ncbi:MAG: hypothetical protein NT023_23830 [Armatimonadetes bacterium]|nr:hypothetical protein [Armatimonadota bacterium]
MDALLGMRMRDLIDDEVYKTKRSQLVLERERLHLALEEVEVGTDQARDANLNAVEYMRYAKEWLKQEDVQMKRLIAENFGTEYTWDGENLLLKPHPLLVKVKKEYKPLEAEYEAIELDKTLSESQKQERIGGIKTKWSGIWELNRTFALRHRLSFVKIAPSRQQSTDYSLA